MLYYLPQDQLNAENHQQIKKGTKTQEEIKKYLLPENLDEPKRILYLLLKGDGTQRRAAIEHLGATLKTYPYIVSNAISIIKEIIPSLDNDLQLILIQELAKIAPKSSEKVMLELSELALRYLQEWKNQGITAKWLQLIQAIILHPGFYEIEEEYLALATKLSGLKEILPLKLAFVRLIGSLSYSLKGKLKGVLLDRIRSFLRSEEKELKLTILKEVMPHLLQTLSVQLINIYFLEKVFEMIYDSEEEIKLATLQLLVSYIDNLSMDDKQRFSKIIIQHLEQPQYHPYFSTRIGEIYMKIHFQVEKRSDIGSFISSYRNMLISPEPSIRYNTLLNTPCLLTKMNFKFWVEMKEEYFDILIEDPDTKVREVAILIYHQVVRVIGIPRFEEFYEMTAELMDSIQLESDECVHHFLRGYQTLLKLTREEGFQLQSKEGDTSYVEKTISYLESWVISVVADAQQGTKKHKGDTIEMGLQVIGECAKHYSTEFLQQNCLPLFYEELEQQDRRIGEPVLKAFGLVLYELVGRVEVSEVMDHLRGVLLERNYKGKIVFIRLARILLGYFSTTKYSELRLFQSCISLLEARVIDIKLEMERYLEQATKYIDEANEQLLILSKDDQIACLCPFSPLKSLALPQAQRLKDRNSECLRNEQQLKLNFKQKQQQRKQEDKKAKPSLLQAKKNRFNLFGKPSNPGLVTINTLLAKEYRINKTLDGMKDIKETKPSKKMVMNRIMEPSEKPSGSDKRKIQSFEMTQSQKKALSQMKRRKTVNQNKYPINY